MTRRTWGPVRRTVLLAGAAALGLPAASAGQSSPWQMGAAATFQAASSRGRGRRRSRRLCRDGSAL